MFNQGHGGASATPDSQLRSSPITHKQPLSSSRDPEAVDSDDASSSQTLTAIERDSVATESPTPLSSIQSNAPVSPVQIYAPASPTQNDTPENPTQIDSPASPAKQTPFGQTTFRLSDSTSIYPSRLFPSANLAFVDDNSSIDIAASTRSLLELYLDYHEENGRRYCRNYYMPNDEFEQTRMYLNHQVSLQLLNGEPTTVPLTNPRKILDIGCGTGDWACQIGECFPNCDVVGKDISAIQPPSAPHNVFFEVEDAEEPWLQNPDSVDLVHFRDMTGAFRDWRFIFEQAFECIRPGGYIELQETDDEGGSWGYICSVFPAESRIHKITQDLVTAAEKAGRPLGISHLSQDLLEEAGFVDIKKYRFDIPISLESGSAGKIWLVSCIDSVEALALRLLTKYMDYDPQECKEVCEQIAQEMAAIARDPVRAQLMQARIHIISGRKPGSGEDSSSSTTATDSQSARVSSETVREDVGAGGKV